MHELGIIVHITKTLQNVAKENNLSEIGSVTLEIGEVSTIVPDYLTDCWKYYRKKFPLIEHSELKIEILPATTYCEDCRQTYPTVEFGRQCPYCKSPNTYLVCGDECNIKEIEAGMKRGKRLCYFMFTVKTPCRSGSRCLAYSLH